MSARRGVWIFVVLLTLAGVGVLLAALSLRHPASPSLAHSVLVFDVPSGLEEDETHGTLPFGIPRRNRYTVYDVVRAIDAAADDDQISSMVLHVDGVDWGWAKLAEVRDAILRFRDSGKLVYASITGGGEPEYFLATAADLVGTTPTSLLMLDGLTISATFMRGTFDKLDIHPNYAHSGRYKSAAESYTRTDMSPDSRVSLGALLDDEYELVADSLASGRGTTADTIRSLLDDGPFSASRAFDRGLVDTLLYESEMDSLAVSESGKSVGTISFTRYLDRLSDDDGGPHLALIAASGEITTGKSRYGPTEGAIMGSETIVTALRQARTRRSIKAIVLRIDSPGGEINGADEIWREVRRCARVKPVIASMSDLAASGGYYIALGADRIVAEPGTITGSIGIFGGKLNLLGLYHKLGLNVETLSRGRHAEMFSPFRDFTPEESAHFQEQMEEGYRLFLARVAQGRRISTADADSLGQGRVWSGVAARDLGLVDSLGGMRTAFQMALTRAGFPSSESYTVERFPKVERKFFERVLEGWMQDEEDNSSIELPPVIQAWLAAARFPVGSALALLPCSITIR
jgi:protease-4